MGCGQKFEYIKSHIISIGHNPNCKLQLSSFKTYDKRLNEFALVAKDEVLMNCNKLVAKIELKCQFVQYHAVQLNFEEDYKYVINDLIFKEFLMKAIPNITYSNIYVPTGYIRGIA